MIPESLRLTVDIFIILFGGLALSRLLAGLVARWIDRPPAARRAAAAAAAWLEGKAAPIAALTTPPIEATMSGDVKVLALYVIIGLAIVACLLLDFIRRHLGS